MKETFNQLAGAIARPAPSDEASCSQGRGDDGSRSVGKSGIGGFDPERLRAMRERADVTQRDLAERLLRATQADWPDENVARAGQRLENVRLQITDYEAGQVTPRVEMLFQLAQALGGDVFELLDPHTPFTLEILRARRGLRQTDVISEGLPVSRGFYSRVERGLAALGEDANRQLATILQVEPDDLAAAFAGDQTVGSMSRTRPAPARAARGRDA